MSFRRPVPTIGDATSAAERAQAPDAWAMPDDLEPLERVVGARRDIRRYRPDPVPDEVLTAVLTAGHRGPSVGHSQPWRFVVVTEAATRDAAALMADRCRLRNNGLRCVGICPTCATCATCTSSTCANSTGVSPRLRRGQPRARR